MQANPLVDHHKIENCISEQQHQGSEDQPVIHPERRLDFQSRNKSQSHNNDCDYGEDYGKRSNLLPRVFFQWLVRGIVREFLKVGSLSQRAAGVVHWVVCCGYHVDDVNAQCLGPKECMCC